MGRLGEILNEIKNIFLFSIRGIQVTGAILFQKGIAFFSKVGC